MLPKGFRLQNLTEHLVGPCTPRHEFWGPSVPTFCAPTPKSLRLPGYPGVSGSPLWPLQIIGAGGEAVT